MVFGQACDTVSIETDPIDPSTLSTLPSPTELAFREEGVKVTLALSKKSIKFFKSEATKHHTQYQRMIRRLLDAYVDAQALTLRSNVTRQKRRAP